MIEILEMELEKFEEDYKKGLDRERSNNYLALGDYEDDYSNNDISKLQNALKIKIEEILEKNEETDYRVYYDWCVHVIHSDFDEKMRAETIRIEEQRRKRFEKRQKVK